MPAAGEEKVGVSYEVWSLRINLEAVPVIHKQSLESLTVNLPMYSILIDYRFLGSALWSIWL